MHSIGRNLHLYKGVGVDPLQDGSRVNSTCLANKLHKKYETLTDSANMWMVCAATTNSLDHGSSDQN
jgi:hypothetical protein